MAGFLLILRSQQDSSTVPDWLPSIHPLFVTTLQIEGPKQIARRSDMDMNGHINNVTYLAWALETVPKEVYETHQLYEVS